MALDTPRAEAPRIAIDLATRETAYSPPTPLLAGEHRLPGDLLKAPLLDGTGLGLFCPIENHRASPNAAVANAQASK